MIYEYPDYYKEFHCIGGVCKDSCCAGWEVDIDDDTAEMYKNVPLPIGDRLREKLIGDRSHYRFKLCPDKRCPFLNSDQLCDIILAMGQGGLSVTCTEYPRYTIETPFYQLTDLTLSCPEASRIFFSTEDPVTYEEREEEYHDTDWEEDPFSDEDFDEEDSEDEDFDFDECPDDDTEDSAGGSKENEGNYSEADSADDMYDSAEDPKEREQRLAADKARLDRVLALRRDVMKILKDRSLPISERDRRIAALFGENPDQLSAGTRAEDELLLEKLMAMEEVNPDWHEIKLSLSSNLKKVEDRADRLLSEGGPWLWNRLERFRSYLYFRYTIEIYEGKDPGQVLRFIRRCCRFLDLLLAEWCLSHDADLIPQTALEDRARIFSRQVEHSRENVEDLLF
ncbi:MAG: flagellin lysine-N-methylase [Lachnospiraceae bacterium]|nr:flagellin lysine-N-methylase [Lachnospiraceae bacterium]